MAVFAVKGVAASGGAFGTLYSKHCYDTILIARQTIALFAIAWDIARQGMNLLL